MKTNKEKKLLDLGKDPIVSLLLKNEPAVGGRNARHGNV